MTNINISNAKAVEAVIIASIIGSPHKFIKYKFRAHRRIDAEAPFIYGKASSFDI